MPCGCSKPNPDHIASAVMCGACYRLDRKGPAAFAQCTVDGKPPLSRPCPRGHHADTTGVLRWLGVRFYGVPAPIRWYGRAGLFCDSLGVGCRVEWSKLPGCGCLVRVKGWFQR